ncbi:hypothetical protein [Butyricimonas sp. DFI.6.44]|uniref:hypothetical protein n=1 Tax=Butyricimonas sp. DFI.6.44 TaxID=2908901 RepID=UPI003F8D6E03
MHAPYELYKFVYSFLKVASPNANIGNVMKPKKMVAIVNPTPLPNLARNSCNMMIENTRFAIGTKMMIKSHHYGLLII